MEVVGGTGSSRWEAIAEIVIPVVFFAALFSSFIHPVKPGDFWFHLSMGREIAQSGEVPRTEPFTYTAPAEPNAVERIGLGGYWLVQVAYYLALRAAGFAGLAVMGALLFTVLFLALYLALRRGGMGMGGALLVVLPIIHLARSVDEVRPHTVSFLFALLTYMIVEEGLGRLRREPSPRPSPRFIAPFPLPLLPLLMVVWANSHQGFLIGLVIIGVYAAAEAVGTLAGRANALSRPALRGFIVVSALALAASLINPGGFLALTGSIGTLRSLPSLSFSIIEQAPPWSFFRTLGDTVSMVVLGGFTAVACGSLALAFRRVRLPHAFLFAGFLVQGLSSLRYMMFFLVMGAAIAGPYLPRPRAGRARYFSRVAAALALCFAIYYALAFGGPKSLAGGSVYDETLPVAAATYMQETALPNPIFNPFEWGGYLTWRLHPAYPVFTDARTTNPPVLTKYASARDGAYRTVFAEYGIATVVFYPIHTYGRSIPPLVLGLLRDTAWDMVYADPQAVVFVRHDRNPGIAPLEKRGLTNYLLGYGLDLVAREPLNHQGYTLAGSLYFVLGEYDKAREFLDRAAALGAGK
jgi:hypothetical protein